MPARSTGPLRWPTPFSWLGSAGSIHTGSSRRLAPASPPLAPDVPSGHTAQAEGSAEAAQCNTADVSYGGHRAQAPLAARELDGQKRGCGNGASGRAVLTRGAIALRASSSRGRRPKKESTLHTREAHAARQSRGSIGGSSGAYNRGAGGGEGPTHPSPTRPRGGGVFALAGLRPSPRVGFYAVKELLIPMSTLACWLSVARTSPASRERPQAT